MPFCWNSSWNLSYYLSSFLVASSLRTTGLHGNAHIGCFFWRSGVGSLHPFFPLEGGHDVLVNTALLLAPGEFECLTFPPSVLKTSSLIVFALLTADWKTNTVQGNRCILVTQHAKNQSLEMICLVLCILNHLDSPDLKSAFYLKAGLILQTNNKISVSFKLQKHGIPVPVTPKAPWSMDANLMHIRWAWLMWGIISASYYCSHKTIDCNF